MPFVRNDTHIAHSLPLAVPTGSLPAPSAPSAPALSRSLALARHGLVCSREFLRGRGTADGGRRTGWVPPSAVGREWQLRPRSLARGADCADERPRSVHRGAQQHVEATKNFRTAQVAEYARVQLHLAANKQTKRGRLKGCCCAATRHRLCAHVGSHERVSCVCAVRTRRDTRSVSARIKLTLASPSPRDLRRRRQNQRLCLQQAQRVQRRGRPPLSARPRPTLSRRRRKRAQRVARVSDGQVLQLCRIVRRHVVPCCNCKRGWRTCDGHCAGRVASVAATLPAHQHESAHAGKAIRR